MTNQTSTENAATLSTYDLVASYQNAIIAKREAIKQSCNLRLHQEGVARRLRLLEATLLKDAVGSNEQARRGYVLERLELDPEAIELTETVNQFVRLIAECDAVFAEATELCRLYRNLLALRASGLDDAGDMVDGR